MSDITADEARKVLADEQRKRLEKCQAALTALLEEHGCGLACQLGIADGRIIGNVTLVENSTS